MRATVLIFTVLMAGCASLQPSTRPLTYNLVEEMEPGKSSKRDIAASFGDPKSVEDREDFQILQYPQDGFQRLTLVVNRATGVLDHLIWIPTPEETQARLKSFLAENSRLHFEEIIPRQNNPHHISTESSFVDQRSGTTLVVRNKEAIDAIIRVDMKSGSRTPATLKENDSDIPDHL